MLFKLFRSLSGIKCYYEPFHPRLIPGNLPRYEWEIERNTKSAYTEYKSLIPEIQAHYSPIGAPDFPIQQELDPKYWTEKHSKYLKYLFSTAENVLVQPVRINYHLQKVYSDIPGIKFIYILRSPEGVVSSLMHKSPEMFEDTKNDLKASVLKTIKKILLKKEITRKYWSQDLVAHYLIKNKARYFAFKKHPLWFKLMLTWYDSVVEVEKLREKIPPGQFARVRYEDICKDPDKIMGELCEWLKIELPKQSFREMVFTEPGQIVKPQDEKWKWARDEIKKVLRE
jgi:hypothetical protein